MKKLKALLIEVVDLSSTITDEKNIVASTGTSMSAPFVLGAAVLIYSYVEKTLISQNNSDKRICCYIFHYTADGGDKK